MRNFYEPDEIYFTMSEVISLGIYFEVNIQGNDKYFVLINLDSQKFRDNLTE